MSNECPKCHEQAMDTWAKIMTRPVVCHHCGQELRMNLVYTIILSLLYFFLVIRIFLFTGMTGAGILYVLLVTAIFVAACVFVPFEEKTPKSQ